MTLQGRLNILFSGIFLLVLVAGGVYLISSSKQRINTELTSTAALTLQLLGSLLSTIEETGDPANQARLLDALSRLESTRHLQIAVLRSRGEAQHLPLQPLTTEQADAPAWFVRLVTPQPMEFRRILSGPGPAHTEILIRADPSDEIGEVWIETRNLLILLLLFIGLANIVVYFSLGRDLRPIEAITRALEGIEHGDYRLRLPEFRLIELRRIASKFNHMADVLLSSREENRLLKQRSLEIQEQERRHLARELHDELGQSISAIKAVAASATHNIEANPSLTRKNMRTILEVADKTYDAARIMMQRLRPTVLDELGLREALQELTDNWNETHGEMFCRFETAGNLDDLGDELNINIYRIVQEGLTNVARHSHANSVAVMIQRLSRQQGEDHIDIVIRDDGCGFDAGAGMHGLGLSGMRERATVLHGEFSLLTQPGRGVAIEISIPLAPDHSAGAGTVTT